MMLLIIYYNKTNIKQRIQLSSLAHIIHTHTHAIATVLLFVLETINDLFSKRRLIVVVIFVHDFKTIAIRRIT